AGRIPGARVLVAAMPADRILGEGRGLVDRYHDGARGRVGLLSNVYRPGGEPGRAFGAHLEARVCAMNSRRSRRVMIPTGRSASITTSAVAPASNVLKASSTCAPAAIVGNGPSMAAPTVVSIRPGSR